MIFRIVLRTKYADAESLGLFSYEDAIEFVRLWWWGNNIQDSHWMAGFESLSIEAEEDQDSEWGYGSSEKGSPLKEDGDDRHTISDFPLAEAVAEGIKTFQRTVNEAGIRLKNG